MANINELVKKNHEQLVKEAERRGINRYFSPYVSYSDKELIAHIVEHDAYYTGRQDEKNKREDRHAHSDEHLREQVQSGEKPSRTLYHMSYDREDYYIRITKEQKNFFDYLCDKGIIYSDDLVINEVSTQEVDEP